MFFPNRGKRVPESNYNSRDDRNTRENRESRDSHESRDSRGREREDWYTLITHPDLLFQGAKRQ
jgi:hypothetical protein